MKKNFWMTQPSRVQRLGISRVSKKVSRVRLADFGRSPAVPSGRRDQGGYLRSVQMGKLCLLARPLFHTVKAERRRPAVFNPEGLEINIFGDLNRLTFGEDLPLDTIADHFADSIEFAPGRMPDSERAVLSLPPAQIERLN